MDREELEDKDWQKIKATFLNTPEPAVSESFVYQVMDRIQSAQAFDLASFLRWLFPTFALMSAVLIISSVWLSDESVAFETAVLTGGSPLTIQEVAVNTEADWTGLEAL